LLLESNERQYIYYRLIFSIFNNILEIFFEIAPTVLEAVKPERIKTSETCNSEPLIFMKRMDDIHARRWNPPLLKISLEIG